MAKWLIVHSENGVLLGSDEDGNPKWSHADYKGEYKKALTFANSRCIERFFGEVDWSQPLPQILNYIEVDPDLPCGNLSKAECIKRGVW